MLKLIIFSIKIEANPMKYCEIFIDNSILSVEIIHYLSRNKKGVKMLQFIGNQPVSNNTKTYSNSVMPPLLCL